MERGQRFLWSALLLVTTCLATTKPINQQKDIIDCASCFEQDVGYTSCPTFYKKASGWCLLALYNEHVCCGDFDDCCELNVELIAGISGGGVAILILLVCLFCFCCPGCFLHRLFIAPTPPPLPPQAIYAQPGFHSPLLESAAN
eukprot:c23516_g1_i1.p1 GENE.c23516_g1_i1~~c23516_g1_i1.p1  ORF type:complete len:157 (+),score=26.42 c23516_g1_i1:42-473(+)